MKQVAIGKCCHLAALLSFNWEVRWLRNVSNALLWAMEHRLKHTNEAVSARVHSLRHDIGREFGPVSRLAGWLLGPFLLWTTLRKERRLALNVTYKPEPIQERRNWPPVEAPPAAHKIFQSGSVPAPMPAPR